MRATKTQVVTVTHGHSELQRSHQRVAGHLGALMERQEWGGMGNRGDGREWGIMKNTSCLKISIIGMVVTGVWLPKSLEDSKWKILYYGYAVTFQLVLFLPLIYVQTVHLFLIIGDISKTVEIGVLLLTHFAQVAKIANIWYRQDKIKNLLKMLESPMFNRGEPEKRAILENAAKNTLTFSTLLVTSSIVTSGLWGVYPLFKPMLKLPLGYPYLEANTTM
ncbi:hypothetical protein EVAR_38209_1 [Eumeta japonica]|uniref:Uncharacterized protein n=1 Tax=Eumeta variegata TaxID=151549 RepID=A0A4C1XFL1_EUMVA|nr:hypothetical protein EVAR_38209_1 [Eumeta japonica]